MAVFRRIFFLWEMLLVSAAYFSIYFVFQTYGAEYTADLFRDKWVPRLEDIQLYLNAYWAALAIWVVLHSFRSGYANLRTQKSFSIGLHLAINGLFFFALFSSVAMMFKWTFLSRTFMAVYVGACILLLAASRLLVLHFLKKYRAHGHNLRRILLVGTGRRAQHFLSDVAKHPEWGYHIVGLLDRDPMLVGEEVAQYRVLGTMNDLPAILAREVVDEVIFVTPRRWLEEVN